MRYFLDCEFIEDGKTIDLLSLSLVCNDGREFYAISTESDTSKANSWVQEFVLPQMFNHLADDGLLWLRGSRSAIREHVMKFLRGPVTAMEEKPEIWGYYADYDWVAFCQLFGTMMHLPKGYPMYCRDIKQFCDDLGNPSLPEQVNEHHALCDARWNKRTYEELLRIQSNQERMPLKA